MRVARIKDNKVVNIEISNETSSDLINIEGLSNIHIGYNFIDGVFSPQGLSLDEILQKRKEEYPPLSDLADATYWQSKGDSSKMEAYILKCDLVKTKYPKV